MFYQFSPNMLKTYKMCPRKFHFKYVKNISMPVDDEIFAFGKNIHALASYYLQGYNIEKMEKSLSVREVAVWNYLKRVKYFEYEVIKTEYNLSVKINEYLFGGRIDALVKDDDVYYILDYKTGSAPKNAKFDYQTIIYMLAVSTFFSTEKVHFVYIDLKNNSETEIVLNSSLIQDYKKLLTDIASKINNDDLPEKPNDCECEYSTICY